MQRDREIRTKEEAAMIQRMNADFEQFWATTLFRRSDKPQVKRAWQHGFACGGEYEAERAEVPHG